MSLNSAEAEWLLCFGKGDAELSARIEQRVKALLESGKLSRSEVHRVAKLDLSAIAGQLAIPDSQLEKLRRLCQLWDVDVVLTHISSHRPFLGPVIVFGKKLLLPILKLLLKDTLRQQRDFNAAALALLAELCTEGGKSKNTDKSAS